MPQTLRMFLDPLDGVPDPAGRLGVSRVLVVDHEPDMRASLKESLEREGFAVTVASSPEDAVELVDRTAFDVVILDLQLPEALCSDLMFFLRHRREGTPVVLLDGVDGAGGQAMARRWGAARLPRPVLVGDLVAVLDALIAERLAPHAIERRWSAPDAGSALRNDRLRVVVQATRGDGGRGPLRAIAPHVPPEQVMVVGERGNVDALEAGLRELPSRPRVLLQPCDRGSATALLLAAYTIHRSRPDATLAVISGRCHATGPAFMEVLEEAARFVNRYPRWIFVLGERSDRATGDPWILPASVLACSDTAPIWRVGAVGQGARPANVPAGAVFRGTGVLVARAARLVSGARELLPSLHRPLLRAVALLGGEAEAETLRRAYAVIPRLDVVAAMLKPSIADLAVAQLAGASWIGAKGPLRSVDR
jgi:CheY-like chemotaxis protein